MRQTHFEEFLWLADVTDEAVLLVWGGFWFRRDDPTRRWHVVPDEALADIGVRRGHSVGAASEPYGTAVVTVLGGVPTFIFNDKFALVGAQDYDVFAHVARRIQSGELGGVDS